VRRYKYLNTSESAALTQNWCRPKQSRREKPTKGH